MKYLNYKEKFSLRKILWTIKQAFTTFLKLSCQEMANKILGYQIQKKYKQFMSSK